MALKEGFYTFGYWDDSHENVDEKGIVLIQHGKFSIVEDPEKYLKHMFKGGNISLELAEHIMQGVNKNHYAKFSYMDDEDVSDDHKDHLKDRPQFFKSEAPQAPSSNPKVRGIAESYMQSKNKQLVHPPRIKVNPERAARIAQAYHSMPHEPNHPAVKAAYDALKNETLAQFKHLQQGGLRVSKIQPGQENPYKSSKDLFRDISENNHMWFFPTEQGYGSDDKSPKDHPMLEPTDVMHEGKPLLANDIFRIVHDYFGHVKEGHGFGPQGEENAWHNHMQMYSPEAQKALTSETRGQNSWVNFGPHAEHNRKNPEKTIYAEQKAGLLPDWAMEHHSDDIAKSDDDYDDLEKSRPSITFPKLPKVPTRPESNVQTLETLRQKKIFGLRAAIDSMRQKEEATSIAGSFNRNRLGVSIQTRQGPKSAALAGHLRSRFEEGDDEYKAKMEAHKERRAQAIRDHNAAVDAWNDKAQNIRQRLNLALRNGDDSFAVAKEWEEHKKQVPKFKAPRAPSKKRVKTEDLSPEQQALRGRSVDSTIRHEAFHDTMRHIGQNYGEQAARKVRDTMLSHYDTSALAAVASFIEKIGYKRKSPYFNEEVLAHARDILVNDKKRDAFKRHSGADADKHIKNLKTGLQRSYDWAKNVTPEDLGKSDEFIPVWDMEHEVDADLEKSDGTQDDLSEHHGKDVFVYFNLHKKVWSIKDRKTGLVIAHAKKVAVDNPQFKVSEAGRQRVLRDQAKNVHAGVVGKLNAHHADFSSEGKKRVSYNPYKYGHFYESDGQAAVHSADHATLHVEEKQGSGGKPVRIPHVYAKNPTPNALVKTEEELDEMIKAENVKYGYRTDHTSWWPLSGHKQEEEEKGNDFPDISKYPDHEAIWVTHTPKAARRYGDDVRQVNLSGAKKFHEDGDGGYLYIRPIDKKMAKADPAEPLDFEAVEGSKPLTQRGKPVATNPEIKVTTKSVLDHAKGVLHTPRGSFEMHFPSIKDQDYHRILNSSDIQDIHSRAMGNWFKLHNMLRSGQKLPKEIVAHANLFSILSANTPVPTQELAYSRLMDTFKKLNVDPMSQDISQSMAPGGAAREAWRASDTPDILPEHSRSYWEGQAKPAITQLAYSANTGRGPGDITAIGTMDSFADRISKAAPLHHYVAGLVDRHGMDAQKIVSQMMQDKANPKLPKDHPMKLGAGLGSKTARYATAMMGGGNVTIPDTHFVRHLFGMDQNTDGEAIDYLKKLLWNPKNHHILNSIDSVYGSRHPAVNFVTNKYFDGKKDPHSLFPAFWLHWLSIAPHEKAQEIGKPFASKNLTDHTPFWDTVNEVLENHGLGQVKKSDEHEMPIYHRTAPAALELEHKLGPGAASLAYYAYIVPHLMSEAEKHDDMGKAEEKIPGGISSGKNPEDFDQEQLAAGIKVEMEHTNDKDIAREIAMDHLSEDPEYYKKLKTMEKSNNCGCDISKGKIGPECKQKLKAYSRRKGWQYPSAVVHLQAGRICGNKAKSETGGEEQKDELNKDLRRWVKEKWTNAKGETEHGSGKSGWRPTVRVSDKTPDTWGEMSPSEKKKKKENKQKANRKGGGWSTHESGRKQVWNTKKSEAELEKGIKEMAIGAAMAGALASPASTSTEATRIPAHVEARLPHTELHDDLKHIAFIESSGGKNKKHAMTTVGVNAGDTAAGSTGLMPVTIKETIQKNPSLSAKYGHLVGINNDQLTGHLNENPGIEHEVANAHWNRLNRVFGGDKSRMAYAWRKGITAAKEASGEEIAAHPYVKKFNELSSRSPAANVNKQKLEKAKKIAEIAKSLVLEKIGQMTHNMQPMSVGHDVFQKDLEAAMGSFAVDTGGIRSMNDRKKEDDRTNSLSQVPNKHKKKFEKAMEEADLESKVIGKLTSLKNKLKR